MTPEVVLRIARIDFTTIMKLTVAALPEPGPLHITEIGAHDLAWA
jgi:hypothetical protein